VLITQILDAVEHTRERDRRGFMYLPVSLDFARTIRPLRGDVEAFVERMSMRKGGDGEGGGSKEVSHDL